jgi:phage recombination protein Bet
MVYFLNVCKARRLNPFVKDVYLIKYSQNDPAAIVTSVDYFRKRARAQADCQGWKSGVIVKTADGAVKDTAGLLQDGETLLGGWFEGKPAGWLEPLRLEVNLRAYIKKTKDGAATRFWSPDNQPAQIAKVAESQGLRKLWPDEFQGLYAEEEITPRDRDAALDIPPAMATIDASTPDDLVRKFDASIPKDAPPEMVEAYLTALGAQNKTTVRDVKISAASDPKELASLWRIFPGWVKAQQKKSAAPEMAPGECPDREGQTMLKEFCDKCPGRVGCPVWSIVDAGF